MGSGAITYIPNLIKIRSAIQKLIGGYINTQHDDSTSLPFIFQNKENRLKHVAEKCVKR
jgi:hypothetical protein